MADQKQSKKVKRAKPPMAHTKAGCKSNPVHIANKAVVVHEKPLQKWEELVEEVVYPEKYVSQDVQGELWKTFLALDAQAKGKGKGKK